MFRLARMFYSTLRVMINTGEKRRYHSRVGFDWSRGCERGKGDRGAAQAAPASFLKSPRLLSRPTLFFCFQIATYLCCYGLIQKKKQLNCVCFLLCYHIFLSVVISPLIIFLEVVLNSLFLPDCNRRRFIVFKCMFLYFNSFGTVVTKKVWCICTWEVSFDSS